MRVGAGLVVLLLALPAGAAAQNSWGSMALPGGAAAFRCAFGVPERIPRARLLVEVGLRVLDAPPQDPIHARLGTYAAWLDELHRRLQAAGISDGRLSLATPGKPSAIDDVLEHAGLRVRRRANSLRVEPRRGTTEEDQLAACLVGPSPDLAATFTSGAPLTLVRPAELVPLPIPETVWHQLYDHEGRPTPGDRLALSILRERRRLFAYVGFAHLPGSTLGFLSDPFAARRVIRDEERRFATYAHALRVIQGSIALPGGRAAASLWQRLSGESPDRAADFLSALLRKDDGRLAQFYATLASLPTHRLKAALGSHPDDARWLYQVFVDSTGSWHPDNRGAAMPALDALTVLVDLGIEDDGRLVAAASRRFWDELFSADGIPAAGRAPRLADERNEGVTLPWIIGRIVERPETSHDRLRIVRFVQRRFGSFAPASGGDVFRAAVVMRLFPALALELERMGIADAALYAEAGEQAARLSHNVVEQAVPIKQWQAAVAIVAALRRTGAIDVPQASRWIRETLAWQPARRGEFGIAAANWATRLLAELPPPAAPGTSLEDRLLSVVAGPLSRESAAIVWEGLTYRTDLAGAQAARARTIAERQPRPRFDDLAALTAMAEGIPQMTTLKDLQAAILDVTGRLVRFDSDIPGVMNDNKAVKYRTVVEGLLKDLRKIRKDKDVKRAERSVPLLTWVIDQLAADVLPALVYAGRMAAAPGAVERQVDLWRRHDYAFEPAPGAPANSGPWRPPSTESSIAGARVTGSLLGFDTAVGHLLLRRIAGAEGQPGRPLNSAIVTPAVMATVPLVARWTPAAPADAGMRAAAAAVQRGREAWARILAGDATDAEPPLRPIAVNLGRWARVNEATAADAEVSLTDLAALGGLDAAAGVVAGVPTVPIDGCWCLAAWPAVMVPVRGERDVARVLGDVGLRTAELLVSLGMPASLQAPVIAAMLGDVWDALSPWHSGEWQAVSTTVRALSRDRLEQFIFALVATRELSVATPGR